jgi:sugar lactone lactonase YvrE
MKRILFLFSLILVMLTGAKTHAHPGSGIVVDGFGNIYFTDTGKGVWKLDTQGKLAYLPSSRFHWLAIDNRGSFANSQKSFGSYFERVSDQNAKPTLVQCSDFPLVINKDGNIYYADTRPSSRKIVRRTPDGKESVLATDRILEFVHGIAVGPDGSIYISEASDPNANTIRKVTMDGKISVVATFAGKSAIDLPLETTPSYCRGLVVDSAGIIYVAATGSRSVLKITPQGRVETILRVPSPWTPTSIAIYKGEVYILEWHDVEESQLEVRTAYIPRIRKIGLDGKVITLAVVSR